MWDSWDRILLFRSVKFTYLKTIFERAGNLRCTSLSNNCWLSWSSLLMALRSFNSCLGSGNFIEKRFLVVSNSSPSNNLKTQLWVLFWQLSYDEWFTKVDIASLKEWTLALHPYVSCPVPIWSVRLLKEGICNYKVYCFLHFKSSIDWENTFDPREAAVTQCGITSFKMSFTFLQSHSSWTLVKAQITSQFCW